MRGAASEWRRALEAWAIPAEILAQAPESPWIHPPALFDVPDGIEESPSHQRARDALEIEGSVLDVGCGGGIAAFALTPPAARVVGVDHDDEMLEMFTRNARRRGVEVETYLGLWPDVAAAVPRCDVVTAHHVVYNVADIGPFLEQLSSHATRRVVIEMPQRHPLSSLSAAWEHFWGLERPTTPTSDDLLAVLGEMGVTLRSEDFVGSLRNAPDLESAARFARIRLCLPTSREDEVRSFLRDNPPPVDRPLTSIWWDV